MSDSLSAPANDLAIDVRGIGKRYRIGLEEERPDTLVGAVTQLLKAPVRGFRDLKKLSTFEQDEAEDIVWALRDVSFQVGHGEVVGIVGHNGAGKSTLLKVLSRITEPSEGYVDLHGRVASLLEVGTGFHPELTGRENVYLNGTILGMTKGEIDVKYDEIVDFAGIAKYIDTPVKRYSSGMKVRLAFAVAAHLEPEILLIDEVLAVGDAAFQRKCLGKMNSVARGGRTVLFVSHDMGAVQNLCPRTIVMQGGRIVFDGDTGEAILRYLTQFDSVKQEAVYEHEGPKEGPVNLVRVRLLGPDGDPRTAFMTAEPVTVEMTVDVDAWTDAYKVGFDLESFTGQTIFRCFHNDRENPPVEPGRWTMRAVIPAEMLNKGEYYVSPCAAQHRVGLLYQHPRVISFATTFKVPNSGTMEKKRAGVIAPILRWDVNPERASSPVGVSSPLSA